jgi:hypothetical protein
MEALFKRIFLKAGFKLNLLKQKLNIFFFYWSYKEVSIFVSDIKQYDPNPE